MNKKIITVFIILIFAAAGISFYAGMSYGESLSITSQEFKNREGFSSDQGNFSRNRQGVSFISGEIISKDDQNITIKAQDGGSKIVFYSEETEINKAIAGDLDDLEIGKFIIVNGSSDQNGNIAADDIQIGSEMNAGPIR